MLVKGRKKERRGGKNTHSWRTSRFADFDFLARRVSVCRERNSARRIASLISLREVSRPNMGGAGASSISRPSAISAS